MAKTTWNNTELKQEKDREDVGFGTSATSKTARLLNSDGTFNVSRRGQSLNAWMNTYNRLITMSWSRLLFIIFAAYILINFVFAIIYYAIGIDQLNGTESMRENMTPFWTAFFFSSQTLTTVGYGHISPVTWLSSSVASIEALIGLMMFAIITGLLYARFSRPNPKVLFSEHMVIAPYLNINGLMFRMINERSNQLINVSVVVTLSRNEVDDKGKISRKYYNLDLERQMVKFFATTWTVVHPITNDSPLYGITEDKMEESDAELLIAVEGTDDTYSDMVNIRKSYIYSDIVYGKKFNNILNDENGRYIVDLKQINDSFSIELNVY